VTPVPTAPPLISGVVNFGGGIVPVVEIAAILSGATQSRLACRGESAVLVEIDEVRAAVRLDAVLEVATLRREGELWTGAGDGPIQLIDPRDMIARARSLLGGESPTR
jgi:hypothetical protein